jgi:hypothetical protein
MFRVEHACPDVLRPYNSFQFFLPEFSVILSTLYRIHKHILA